MDDYRRLGNGEWGSKARKALSRGGKAALRQIDVPRYAIIVGRRRYVLKGEPEFLSENPVAFEGKAPICPGREPRIPFVRVTGPTPCGVDLGRDGMLTTFHMQGDRMECPGCGAHYPLVEV